MKNKNKENENIDYYNFSTYDYLTHKILGEQNITSTTNYVTDTCYITSNELLSKFMPNLNFKDSRVATVGSSGDQVLNAILYGAKDITLIDCNPYARAYVEYKIALIKNLSYKKFMDAILSIGQMFQYSTYRKISHDLSKETQEFWDRLILEQDFFNSDFTIYFQLFGGKSPEIFSQFYEPIHYEKLQQLLQNKQYSLNFINAEFTDFSKKLDGTFDIILLSNIADYVDVVPYLDEVMNLFEKKLNPGGVMQLQYYFQPHMGYGKKDPKYKDFATYFQGYDITIPENEGPVLLHKPKTNTMYQLECME